SNEGLFRARHEFLNLNMCRVRLLRRPRECLERHFVRAFINHFNLHVRVVQWTTNDTPTNAVDREFGAYHRLNCPMRRESSLFSEFPCRKHYALVMRVACGGPSRDRGKV